MVVETGKPVNRCHTSGHAGNCFPNGRQAHEWWMCADWRPATKETTTANIRASIGYGARKPAKTILSVGMNTNPATFPHPGSRILMVTLTFTPTPSRLRLPTRPELRAMLQHRSVAITLILCGTALIALMIGAVVFLSANGYGTEALVGAIVIPLVTALVNQANRLKQLESAVRDSPVITTPTE